MSLRDYSFVFFNNLIVTTMRTWSFEWQGAQVRLRGNQCITGGGEERRW
jgi:hypothetical protein